jgi:hypothetical protein
MRRRLGLLAAAFFTLRLVLVLGAADRLSQPDAAEVKLMAIGDSWIHDGAPSLERISWHVRAGTNAPHGAYLPTSMLYALLVVPFGAAGSYLALKLVAILFATLGFVAWTATAWQLGGLRAAAVMAGLLFFPPPGFLAGTMVPWGSHPESAALVGLVAWVITSGRARSPGDCTVAGLLLGGVVGCSLLSGPLVATLAAGWAWDAWRQEDGPGPWGPRVGGLVLGAGAALGAMLWLTGGLSASVVETAGSSPLQLLTGPDGGTPGLIGATVAGLVPPSVWPLMGSDLAQQRLLDILWGLLLTLGLLLAVIALAHRKTLWGRGAALLVLGPLAHLAAVVLLAPRRPMIPPRYLLVLTPLALLGLALAVAWWSDRGRRMRTTAAAVAVLWLVPCVGQQLSLLEPSRMSGFAQYQPAAWLAADIGRVTYDEAPWVNRFLAARGVGQADGFGFAAGVGASDTPFAADEGDALDPRALMDRRDRWLDRSRSAAERRRLHENIGWSLAVFGWERTGVWHAVLSNLPPSDREATAFGLGLGLGMRGSKGCAAARRMMDADAILAGARSLGRCL